MAQPRLAFLDDQPVPRDEATAQVAAGAPAERRVSVYGSAAAKAAE